MYWIGLPLYQVKIKGIYFNFPDLFSNYLNNRIVVHKSLLHPTDTNLPNFSYSMKLNFLGRDCRAKGIHKEKRHL